MLRTPWTHNRVDWYEDPGSENSSGSYVITNAKTGAYHVNSEDMVGDGVPDIVAGAPGNSRIARYEKLYDPGVLGTNYCTAAFNSSGGRGTVSATGSNVLSDNDLAMTASSQPNDSLGLFLVSQTQVFRSNPVGSQGNLCTAGDIGRYVASVQIKNSGSTGTFSLLLDLTQVPQPTGLFYVQAGETWNVTTWFRDAIFGIPVSSSTDGIEMTLQ